MFFFVIYDTNDILVGVLCTVIRMWWYHTCNPNFAIYEYVLPICSSLRCPYLLFLCFAQTCSVCYTLLKMCCYIYPTLYYAKFANDESISKCRYNTGYVNDRIRVSVIGYLFLYNLTLLTLVVSEMC